MDPLFLPFWVQLASSAPASVCPCQGLQVGVHSAQGAGLQASQHPQASFQALEHKQPMGLGPTTARCVKKLMAIVGLGA